MANENQNGSGNGNQGGPPADPGQPTQPAKTRGILFVALGARAAAIFQKALEWLKASENTLPVTVISDVLTSSPDYTVVTVPSPADGFESRIIKTTLNTRTPYDRTLYLDVDVAVLGKLDRIFSVLDKGRAKVAMALDRLKTLEMRIRDRNDAYLGKEEWQHTKENYPKGTPFFNTGVIVWETGPEADKLFSTWNGEWNLFKRTDQMAMSRALCKAKVKVERLKWYWNADWIEYPHSEAAGDDGARVVHFWLNGQDKFLNWK